ncbi:MAG: hypothetical protein IPL33_12980 [Sphingobacteriales bacterium]|nr:hypothetical protein [Sphingobacteriales bacterium]
MSPLSTTTYTVTVSDANGCTSLDAVTVTVETGTDRGRRCDCQRMQRQYGGHECGRFIDFGRRIGRRVQCCWRRTRFVGHEF